MITPYASLMATPFAAGAVAENLARFAELGAIGRLGASIARLDQNAAAK